MSDMGVPHERAALVALAARDTPYGMVRGRLGGLRSAEAECLAPAAQGGAQEVSVGFAEHPDQPVLIGKLLQVRSTRSGRDPRTLIIRGGGCHARRTPGHVWCRQPA